MARPCKWRCVERSSAHSLFKPAGIPSRLLDCVTLSLDELEALRLVDLEGLTQEEAAERLGISRSTVSRVAARARKTVAEALIGGKALLVERGLAAVMHPLDLDLKLDTCAERGSTERASVGRGSGEPGSGVKNVNKETSMIVAVPYIDGQVDPHFGKARAFLIAETGEQNVASASVYDVEGLQHNHSGVAGFLRSRGATVVLAGGMGRPMQMALKGAGLNVYCGVSGPAVEAVEAFLRGETQQTEATCGGHAGGGCHSG